MSDNKKVAVDIIANATEFRRTIKEVQAMQTDLGKVTAQARKGDLKQTKALEKIQKTYNKQQKGLGKAALSQEKSISKAIDDQIKRIKEKQKQSKGSAAAIAEEVKNIQKLTKEYKEIQKFRKSTGVKTMGERFKGSTKGLGKGLGALGLGIAGVATAGITGLLSALVGAVTSQIQSSYASYMNYGRSRAALAGMGNPTLADELAGSAYGFSRTETVQQMHGVGRQTGQIGAVTTAQRVARSFGGDVGEVSGFMGVLTRAGQGFGGKAGIGGKQQLERIMQHAFTAGMDKSRAGEHLTSVAQAVQSAQSVSGGRVDAASISAMLAFFGKNGGPGLQGAAGLSQLSKIDQGIKAAGFGGGSDPVSAMMYQAMGFGTPGGNTDLWTAMKRLQRGAYGKGGAQNILDVFNRVSAAGGGPNSTATNYMLSTMFNMSGDVVEDMWKAIQSSGGDTASALKQIEGITKRNAPIEQRNLDANLEVAQRVAGLDNRLVDMGSQLKEPLEAIQDVINNLVDMFLPDIVDAVKKTAFIIKQIYDGFSQVYNWRRDANKMGAASYKTKTAVNELLTQVTTSGMTRSQALQELPNIARRLQTELGSANTNILTMAGEILSGDMGQTRIRGYVHAKAAISQMTALGQGIRLNLDDRTLRDYVQKGEIEGRLAALREVRDAGPLQRMAFNRGEWDGALDSHIQLQENLLRLVTTRLGKYLTRTIGDTENPAGQRADTTQSTSTNYR